MRITLNNKRIQMVFLLCSLLFLECFSYGIFSFAPSGVSGINNPAASWSRDANSAMRDSVEANLDVMGASNYGLRINLASSGNKRGQSFNNNYFFSGAAAAALLAVLISYLRLSRELYFQFDSLQITTFLHKKDGMK